MASEYRCALLLLLVILVLFICQDQKQKKDGLLDLKSRILYAHTAIPLDPARYEDDPSPIVVPSAITGDSPASHGQMASILTPSQSPSRTPYPPLPPPDEDEHIAICMAVKDQGPLLAEFLTHHFHHHGIRRFYIHDDGSDPPLSTLTYPIPSTHLTFIRHPPTPASSATFPRSKSKKRDSDKDDDDAETRPNIQESYYTNCIDRFGHKHTWMGFLDTDEFVEMVSREYTLLSWLKSWEGNGTVGALAVEWIVHTSAGYVERPQGMGMGGVGGEEGGGDGVQEAGGDIGKEGGGGELGGEGDAGEGKGWRHYYDQCMADYPDNDNVMVKSFVKTAVFGEMYNPHCMDTFHPWLDNDLKRSPTSSVSPSIQGNDESGTVIASTSAEANQNIITVAENGDPVPPPCERWPATREIWALHHFATGSRQDFEEKRARGHIQGGRASEEWWESVEGEEWVDCPVLGGYWP